MTKTKLFIYNVCMQKEKILIMGAGISGLYTALLLQDICEVILVEARTSVGGRVLSLGGHDMGPSWVWGHQKYVLELIDTLGLTLFEQYTQGLSLYDAPDGVQKFRAPPAATSYRVKGGIISIVKALEAKLYATVKLNEKVMQIQEHGNVLNVQTDKTLYVVDKVISTLPPRLVEESIQYYPPLDKNIQDRLKGMPTWMGYATKCVIEYAHAFWREAGMSGFTFSHLGPLGEIHDACTTNKAALFGFVQSMVKNQSLEENIVKQLIRLYGEKAANPIGMYVLDWKKEQYTSTSLDARPLVEHPSYGFTLSHFGEKMLFSGTESAHEEGGYLEGAIYAAKSVSQNFK